MFKINTVNKCPSTKYVVLLYVVFSYVYLTYANFTVCTVYSNTSSVECVPVHATHLPSDLV